MKKVILITLLIAVYSGEPASGQSRGPYHTDEEIIELIQNVKMERSYLVGTEEELILTPGQAIRLNFKDNSAGVKDFIFFYNNKYKTVYIYYRYTNDTEKEYQGTRLYLEKKKDYRAISLTRAKQLLSLFYEFEPKDNKAFVKFRTTLSLTEKDRQQIKEIDEAIRRRKAGNTIDAIVARLRKKASQESPYKFGTVKEVTIVPDQEAVRLKCSDNPEGVEEILIGANSQHLYIYCVLCSGSITGGGSTWKEGPGSFRQVGGSVAIGMWEHKDGKIHVKFQLNDDDSVIIQSYRKLEKAAKSFPKGRFSQMIKDWGALFEDTELIFPRLSAEQRVEAFTRLWCTAKFNFANFDLIPELNWDNVLSEYLPKVIADQSNDAYVLLLQKCIGLLKDGHTSVTSRWGRGFSSACPPLRIRSISGKAIVTETTETEEMRASGIKPGDEITHVDGRTVREILEKDIYPYFSASTPQGRDLKAYPRILQGPKESTVSLSVKTLEGATRKVFLTRNSSGLAMIPRQTRRSDFEYRDLGDGLVYVALNTFGSPKVVEKFKEKFKEISQAKGLVIDVRKNGGGSSSNGDAIISCLIKKAIPHTLWKTPQHIAAFKAWGRPKKWFEGEPRMIEPRQGETYLGPLVVLIGPGTNSAAEDFVVPLHAAGRATIVGEKSRGSTGQPLRFSFLDGKIRGRVCTKRDTYPDGREFVGVGIIPDVEINPAPADIAAGRDVVLEKAIEYLCSLNKAVK